MIVTFDRIPAAVETEKQTFLEWAKVQPSSHYVNDPTFSMVACVFVQQVSARRYHVGWRWTKRGTPVGEIQKDLHPAYSVVQRIAWTSEGETNR